MLNLTPLQQNLSEILVYQSIDGQVKLEVKFYNESIWLSQSQMAELFQCSTDNINLHLKNIYAENELTIEATTEHSSVVRLEGKRKVTRTITLYNLNAILAVGYRVKSARGTQFRIWATQTLQEYLLKGFVLDDERLKNPKATMPDYFDEMLARIRDIRASE